MGLRLGSGDYERIDVDIRQSTLEARHLFFQTLGQKKCECFRNLLRLFNSEIIPYDYWNEQNYQYTFFTCVLALSKKLPSEYKLLPDFIDTPVFHYYSFLSKKELLIKKLENDEELQKFVTRYDPNERKNNSLKQIIPNWNELKANKEAKLLCQSLENWADKYHLNEDWLLDFALQILRHFKLNFDTSLSRFYQSENQIYLFHSLKIDYEIDIEKSVGKAIFDYHWEEVMRHDWVAIFENLPDTPSFIYRWHHFELPSNAWVVTIESRQHFCNKMREILNTNLTNLKYSEKFWGYSDEKELDLFMEGCKKKLEIYCDEIEKRLANAGDESFIEYTFADFGIVGTANWYPSRHTRGEFIEDVLPELKNRIEKNSQALQSLTSFTKSHFEKQLTKYCNEIEKNLPANFSRTPQKYDGEKHFEWLIDYQVTPFNSFREIAKTNSTDKKTISEPVKDLANMIGLSLRNAKRGRPLGVKNSPKSNRQLGILTKTKMGGF